MGVKGLGSFLKDNRGSLCRSIELPSTPSSTTGSSSTGDSNPGGEPVTVVVDAWSILFPLYLASLPWQSGGEYLRFYRIVCRFVESWRRVGVEPVFVFDGASPPEKHNTLLKRLNEQLSTSLLFYTTSASSRSSPSFSRNSILLPPMIYHTMVHALHNSGAKSHHVPIGEADGFVVSLAESLGAYILSQDSDYPILMSNAGLSRVKGYCPLDMVSWIEGDVSPSADAEIDQRSTGGWEVATPRREAYAPRQSHLLPSPLLSSPTLILTFVPPTALRTRLRLPPSVMPLFASLCGNDYTPPNLAETLFEPGLKASSRIEKVARVIRETLYGPTATSPKTTTHSSGDVAVELVRKIIKKLAIRDFSHEGALQTLVEGVIESTFQYVLPLDRNCCDLYPFCGEMEGGCQTRTASAVSSVVDLPSMTAGAEGESSGKKAYAEAVRMGYAGSMAHIWAYPGRMYLWNVLEDPNGASLKAGEGARALRSAAWGHAEEALGGLRWPMPIPDEEVQATSDIDIDDAPAPIEVDGKTETSEESTLVDENAPSETKTPSAPRRVITEYIRQSNRIVPVELPLPSPSTRTTPAALLPLHDRLDLYLSAMQSDLPSIRALPPHLQAIVAVLRFTILEASRRSDASKWRRPEVVNVLRASLGTFAKWDAEWSSKVPTSPRPDGSTTHTYRESHAELYPLLTNRNASLVASLAATMTDSIYLAQSLLLHPDPIPAESPSVSPNGRNKKVRMTRLPHLIPFVWCGGATLHAILGGRDMGETSVWRWEEREAREFEACWKALGEDMEDHVVGWGATTAALRPGLGAGADARGGEGSWRDQKTRETKRPAESAPEGRRAGVNAPSGGGNGGAAGGGGGVKAMLEKMREEDRKKATSGRFDLLESLGDA